MWQTSLETPRRARCGVCRGMECKRRWKKQFVPGLVRRHVHLWQDVTLKDHPLRDTLVSYVRDGVDLHGLILNEFKGPSIECPYDVSRFPGTVFKTV